MKSSDVAAVLQKDSVRELNRILPCRLLKLKKKYGFLLHQAAACGAKNIVKFLIERANFSANERDGEGFTAVMRAVQNNHVELLEWFCTNTCVFLSKRTSKFSTLSIAIQNRHIHMTRLLLPYFSKSAAEDMLRQQMMMSSNFNAEWWKLVLEHVVPDSALSKVIRAEDTTPLLRGLIASGKISRAEVQQQTGSAELDCVGRNNDCAKMQFLLDCGVDPNTLPYVTREWHVFRVLLGCSGWNLGPELFIYLADAGCGPGVRFALRQNLDPMPWVLSVIDAKFGWCEEDQLEFLKQSHDRVSANLQQRFVDITISLGHMTVLRFLLECANYPIGKNGIEHALFHGQMKIARYLAESRHLPFQPVTYLIRCETLQCWRSVLTRAVARYTSLPKFIARSIANSAVTEPDYDEMIYRQK